MKRFALILFSFCFLFLSCKKDDELKTNDHKIRYNGPEVIDIVLLEQYTINATSDETLTYYSDNELYVTVSPNGIIEGKNVGEAKITISNSHESITLQVVVSLFEEPTLNFYASQNKIRSLYGTPSLNYGDSIYVYGSGNDWYSYAVWEMDFFFIDDQYIESDLYMRNDLETRINQFLDEKYYYQITYTDTIVDQQGQEVISNIRLYLDKQDASDANVMIGMQDKAGTYKDICLFYIPFDNDKYDYKKILSRDRRRRE